MADQFERLHVLVDALVEALGEDLALGTLVSDLGLKGAEGKAIQRSLRLTGNLYRDCRNLILACREYPNAINDLHDILSHYFHLKSAWLPLQAALQPFLSSDRSVAAAASQPAGQSVYISYAWGDPTPEGKRRGQLVDDLCQALSVSGIKVLIDREQVKPGERISAFMDAISKGDVIIVVLSNRYLESEACMYELNGIWTRACHDEHLFLARVIPLTLPDAKLKTTQDFLARGEFWLTQQRDLESRMDESRDSVGPTLFQRYWSIKQFAQHAPDMLVLLLDKQEPRDFERQAQEGFREVVAQILAARSA
jgi:hypothetical protein